MILKNVNSYSEYVRIQDNRGAIDDSSLRFDKSIAAIIERYNITINDLILDIGTRNGMFIKQLHDNGFVNSYGTDISISAKENWGKKYDSTFNNFLALEDAQQNVSIRANVPYKLVTMSHVLEHMYDPSKTMNNIKSSLDANGIVYIVVPEENNTKHAAHYTAFESLQDLINFCEACGMEVVESVKRITFCVELCCICKIKNL
jgi:2-polyprenyl-3-methyl-5-hydroxy-6-metoxy-1,4-benzoquinol methylase